MLLFCAIAGLAGAATGGEPVHNLRPKHGYVPDAATAIKIAVAVWEPIYGEAKISEEKPYRAVLHDGMSASCSGCWDTRTHARPAATRSSPTRPWWRFFDRGA